MPSPVVTILIPTRDRAETLLHCLKTVRQQPNQNIEILVSDNLSGPEVKAVIDSFSDNRIRYIRTPERLGMTEHWNWAIKQISGDWVTILGDDDGLLPGAIDKLLKISAENPDVKLITSNNCFYTWPSAAEDGKPKFRLVSGKNYEVRPSKENLRRTMLGEIRHLPTIYTGGFVHRSVVEQIISKTPGGNFFNSIIPDVYSGMAMTSVTEKYIYSWEPWAIAGASKFSNGQQHKNKSRAEIKNLDFYKEAGIGFLPSLGDAAVESMQILLYESFLKSQHLRSDDFGVTLQQQLEIAILQATKRVRADVIEYCRDVAKLNNIDFEPILNSARKKVRLHIYKRMLKRLSRKIPGVSKTRRININAANMNDVYIASIETGKLLAA